MGAIRLGPPEDLTLALRDRCGLDHFIETGTFRGDTSVWAAAHFRQVTTIERSPAIHAAFKARFGALAKVRAVEGDSRDGSSLLLPSGHAGLALDLMPADRWANFGQDLLNQERGPRLSAYRYRFLPIDADVAAIARCASAQVAGCAYFRRQALQEVTTP